MAARQTRRLSRAELEAENKFLRKHKTAEAIASVINTLIKWSGLTLICVSMFGLPAYYSFRIAEVTAGKTTNTTVSVYFEILGNVAAQLGLASGSRGPKTLIALSLLIGIGGVLYGMLQHKLRKRVISRNDRIRVLEQRIDSNRSSSRLTEEGTTRPEDDYARPQ